MVKCSKRQRELHNGIERFRCIHPESSRRGQIVDDCRDCPLMKPKIKPCKEKAPKPKQLPVLKLAGYPECPYRYRDASTQKCSITNLQVDKKICGRCDKETRERSSTLGQKVKNYFGAIRRWVASGCPARDEAEIRSLFETHCKKCERYDNKKHACKNCGCQVSVGSEPLTNKLAMATEHCPLGRF